MASTDSPNQARAATRIDEVVDGIYRISTWTPEYGITFNQFLIDDERPALIHTGEHWRYEAVRKAITEVLDPRSRGSPTEKCSTSESISCASWRPRTCTTGTR